EPIRASPQNPRPSSKLLARSVVLCAFYNSLKISHSQLVEPSANKNLERSELYQRQGTAPPAAFRCAFFSDRRLGCLFTPSFPRKSPRTYAAARRSATLRYTDGSAQRTAATTAHLGITDHQTPIPSG